MERSQDVRDAFVRFLESISSGIDVGNAGLAFPGDGASLIGSEPSEWLTGAATRQKWTGIARFCRATGMRIVPGAPDAYADGPIGWVIDRPTFRNRAGAQVQTRMTGIFRREGAAWQLIHLHTSIAVSDEQIDVFRGFEMPATESSDTPARPRASADL